MRFSSLGGDTSGMSFIPRAASFSFVSVVAVLAFANSSNGQPSISGIPAQGPTELFVPADPPMPALRRSDAAIVRSRSVRIVREALAKPERLVGRELVLELFDDTVVSLGVEKLRRRSPQAYTLTGRVAGADQGFFALVVEEHVVLANIRVLGKGYYQLQYLGQGVHAVQEVDESLQKPCGVENEADSLSSPYPVAGTQSLQTLVDDGSELDVLVVYTPGALAAAGGVAAIHGAIELGVAEANLAFENSLVSTRVRVVHREEVPFQESGSSATDLTSLRDGTDGLDVAHALRDEFCADVISLIVDPFNTDTGGRAYIMNASRLPPYDFAPRAVNLVNYYSFRGLTFAHELGHNLGAMHDRENACSSGECTDLCCAGDSTKEQAVGSYDYSYGHRILDQWRKIAANWRTSCTDPDPPELGLTPPAQPGDILSANTATGELFRVDSSGDRGVLSSEDVGSGPSFRQPYDVTLEADGQILMADRRNRALVRVDPQTGDRMIFSGCTTLDCSAPSGLGPNFSELYLLTVENSGDALVTATQRSIFRVELASGDRTILSGCSDIECSSVIGGGPEFISPRGIAVESSGDILVNDRALRSVLRVDPTSGDRTVVSGCIDESCSSTVGSGVAFESPYDVVVEADGSILVTEFNTFDGTELRALFRVNPNNGVRTILSGCKQLGCMSVVGAGTNFSIPAGLALNASGEILVTDYGLGAVFRVDPINGNRIVFSGCLDPSCSSNNGSGPPFAAPIGITILPEPEQLLLLVAGMGLLGVFSRKRRAGGSS